jgi:hypothetical protein
MKRIATNGEITRDDKSDTTDKKNMRVLRKGI